MILYKERDYSKSVQTWIEVVCKYILDVFPHLSTTMLALLVEVRSSYSLSYIVTYIIEVYKSVEIPIQFR